MEVGRHGEGSTNTLNESNEYLEGRARLHVVATGAQSVEVETERGVA